MQSMEWETLRLIANVFNGSRTLSTVLSIYAPPLRLMSDFVISLVGSLSIANDTL